MASQPILTTRRRDLPPHLREKMQQKSHKLWTRTRCPRLKKKLNELARKLAVAVRDQRGTAWEETIDDASESVKKLHQLNRRLAKNNDIYMPDYKSSRSTLL
ncbi:hypothetical protein EVAR_30329_1 [Eumeta japonica]|uniref:RNA-directed DNA polymerase from transposon X-element n=1 Tax=Eumeta variegata TaxID=151549 RepID=A0A4C1WBU7_EUMVA|nr:hypothetical protein EVAR_30329_1 [Eumeta japonica]